MLALEILGRRINEDRPQAKFAKTPNYAIDVKWLHEIAQRLGNYFFFTNLNDITFEFILRRYPLCGELPDVRDGDDQVPVPAAGTDLGLRGLPVLGHLGRAQGQRDHCGRPAADQKLHLPQQAALPVPAIVS